MMHGTYNVKFGYPATEFVFEIGTPPNRPTAEQESGSPITLQWLYDRSKLGPVSYKEIFVHYK